MFEEPIHIVDGNIFAYLLVDYNTKEILDANSLARVYYKNTSKFPPLESLFSTSANEKTLPEILQALSEKDSVILERTFSTKVTEETFPCYLEICKVSSNLILFVIKEKSVEKDYHIESLVELRDNPIFVLEDNEELSVSYGNERFFYRTKVYQDMAEEGKVHSFLSLLTEEKRGQFRKLLHEKIERYGECNIDIELTLEGEYDQLFRFSAYKSQLDEKLYGVLISAKKQSELMRKIEYDQQYFDIMQKFSKDLLFRIDIKKNTLVHRGDINKLVGLLPELKGFPECMRGIDLLHPEDLDEYIKFCYRLLSGSEAKCEPRFHFVNGSYEKYRLQGNPLFDADGNTVQVVGKCENIQKLIDIETKANYDMLTRALNKQSFKELVEDCIHRALEQDKFALLFLDLDDFKSVNDNYGHIFGDFMLEACSKRILNCIRKQDRLGRVGGDEFVIFFQFAPTHQSVLERAEAILHSLRREFNNEGSVCKTKASIGISLFPEHGDSYEMLYDRADKALYSSKAKGKDLATIYSENLEK